MEWGSEVGMPYGGDVGTRLGETAAAGRELAHPHCHQKYKNTKLQNTKNTKYKVPTVLSSLRMAPPSF